MSAPGADPLAAIRQRAENAKEIGAVSVAWSQDIPFLLKQWDTRESALRALVAQLRETGKQFRIRAISQLAMGTTWGCIAANAYDSSADAQFSMADALERLLSGPQP